MAINIHRIPPGDMACLVRRTSDYLLIDNVSGDITPLLRSMERGRLTIRNMKLSTADTENLKFAMEQGPKTLSLGENSYQFKLDMETLAKYDGRGKCHEMSLCGSARSEYRAQAIQWARSIGWKVYKDDPIKKVLIVRRKLPNGESEKSVANHLRGALNGFKKS